MNRNKVTNTKSDKTILMVVADDQGEIFEYPQLLMAGQSGKTPLLPSSDELIPMPEGSRLFFIPDAKPIGFRKDGSYEVLEELPKEWGGGQVQAVTAFLTPAFTRTLLPAAQFDDDAPTLPLWAYTAVGWCVEEERFYVSAVQVDKNNQWEPDHFDDRKLDPLVKERLKLQPNNRLLEQLARCAVDYHCFAAKNLFFKRWEAPLPVSPICNSRCLGCISLQEAPECCPSSQDRLSFVPTVAEQLELAVPHLMEAENAIVSYGQGCEGDPILQADTVSEAVRQMRKATPRGTINFNSNASLPDSVDMLAEAGIDSIRVSINSVREEVYNAYYRPRGYKFADVLESISRAKGHGLFTMLNYLVFPGVTDQQEELDALIDLIDKTGIDLIQMRNLSIDPRLYWSEIDCSKPGIGIKTMMHKLKERFPKLQFGYFNRTKESFYPDGYETDWPINK